jgi:hypothetical protein
MSVTRLVLSIIVLAVSLFSSNAIAQIGTVSGVQNRLTYLPGDSLQVNKIDATVINNTQDSLTFRVIAEWSGDDIWVTLGQRELKPMASGTLGSFSTADLAGSAPAYVCELRLVAIKDLGTPQETWSVVDTQVFGFNREGN